MDTGESMVTHETNLASVCWLATGIAIGAGLMYFFDPEAGRRRRALVRDKAVHYQKETAKYASDTTRDLRNRAYGVYAEARGLAKEAVTGNPGSEPEFNRPQG